MNFGVSMWLYCTNQQRWANLAKIGKKRTECSKYGFPNDRLLLRDRNIGSCTRCVVSLPGNSWNVATDHKTDLLCRGPDPAQVGRYRSATQCNNFEINVLTIFRSPCWKGLRLLAPTCAFTLKKLLWCREIGALFNKEKVLVCAFSKDFTTSFHWCQSCQTL